MWKRLSDNYILSLICVTIFLTISYMFLTPFTTLAWIFAIWGSLTTIAIIIRTIFPKVRNSILYQILILFDVTALAQIIRKKMTEVKGKGRKKRQGVMLMGTLSYSMGVFLAVKQFFFGGTLTNMDNGISVYIPPLIEKITYGAFVILILAAVAFIISIFLIGIGFYGKFEKFKSINEFAEDISKKRYTRKSTFWEKMSKKEKYLYTTVLTVTFALMCVEFYALGFIVSPAQTYGTSLEPQMTEQVLSVFGNWTNIILAEIGVLAIIGLTMWTGGYIMHKLQVLAEKSGNSGS
jgi:hypothetical protein